MSILQPQHLSKMHNILLYLWLSLKFQGRTKPHLRWFLHSLSANYKEATPVVCVVESYFYILCQKIGHYRGLVLESNVITISLVPKTFSILKYPIISKLRLENIGNEHIIMKGTSCHHKQVPNKMAVLNF